MGSRPLSEAPSYVRFFVYAYAVVVGLAPLPSVVLGGLSSTQKYGPVFGAIGALALGATIAFSVWLTKRMGERGAGHAAYVSTGLLLLVVLPLAGLVVDGFADACDHGKCDPNFRPLAMPEVFGLLPLHLVSTLGFFLCTRRPEALSPRAEALLATSLFGGLLLQLALAIQFFPAVPLAIFLIPLPIVTPYLAFPLLLQALVARLRARGHEALIARAEEEARAKSPPEVGYREASIPEVLPKVETRRPLDPATLGRALLGLPVLLGLHAVVNGLLFRSVSGGVDAFLRTCHYPLSQLPLPPPQDCHYLCTIAAQGSPGLVSPLRWGVRRGKPIVVNRQLALANAFEDLLHERWPALGRVSRRTYDALAFPVSQHLTRRWIANALYLAMKPAELVFALVLLFADPGDPEARIARMYK